MSRLKHIHPNQRGFVLVGMLFLMILIAVTAVALNRKAGLEARISTGQARSVQTRFDQTAVVEAAVWKLTKNPLWRTAGAGEDYDYNDTTYNRKVLSSTVSGMTDAAVVSVIAPGMLRPLGAAFRYYIYPPVTEQKTDKAVYKGCADASDNLYFAVPDKHVIYRRNASDQSIVVVAGNGTSGFSGDGNAAVDAQLRRPQSVFVDDTGNIYIADTGNHCIRKVDATGNISTVAGTGELSGSTGDNGLAVNARLDTPKDIIKDTAGDIYIADTGNNRVRKFTEGGNITNVAGTGNAAYSGDGGAAVSAELNAPSAVFMDEDGNLHIADTGNHCIRRIDTAGDISTEAGTGTQAGFAGDGGAATSAELNAPEDVWVVTLGGPSYRIYIADTGNHRIREVGTANNILTYAGTGAAGYSGDGGNADMAMIDTPSGIMRNNAGDIILSDTGNACLRLVDIPGRISSLFAASGLVIDSARKIILDTAGNLYVADTENHRVRKLDTSGSETTVAGNGHAGFSGDGGAAVAAMLNRPMGLALDDTGNIYIADTGNHCIRKVDTSGNINTVAGMGTQDGYSGNPGFATSSLLDSPEGVTIQNLGEGNVRIYIADTGNHCIRAVNFNGLINTVAGIGTQAGFSGDGGAANNAELNAPKGVFFITDRYYIADTGNHCIRKVDSSGNISTVAGMGTQAGESGDNGTATAAKLNEPGAIFVDTWENIFIADTGNQRIRVVSSGDNNIYTLAGNGTAEFNGENLPAVDTTFDQPAGIAMDAVRGGLNIYASDTGNNRIRVLNFKMVKEMY